MIAAAPIMRDDPPRPRPMPLLFSRRKILAHGAALAASAATPPLLFTSAGALAQVVNAAMGNRARFVQMREFFTAAAPAAGAGGATCS